MTLRGTSDSERQRDERRLVAAAAAVTDRVTIELGEPGHSDIVLAELRRADEQLGLGLEGTLALLLGYGIAAARKAGTLQ